MRVVIIAELLEYVDLTIEVLSGGRTQLLEGETSGKSLLECSVSRQIPPHQVSTSY